FSSRKSSAGVQPTEEDRRASPLFFHVGEAGGNAYGVLLFLPAEYLPKEEQIDVHGTRVDVIRDPDLFYAPVNGFLDRFVRPGGGSRVKEPFGSAKEVARRER